MRYKFAAALPIVLLLSAAIGAEDAARAQAPSGMGATSPLSQGVTLVPSQSAVPLGATEINPGGLSPSPCAGTSIPGTSTASGIAGQIGVFDGGGLDLATSASSACGAAASGGPAAAEVAAPPGGFSGGGTMTIGGPIPLGATELSSTGLSAAITVPMPTVSSSLVASANVAPGTMPVPGVAPASPCLINPISGTC
jgi:hypothetical protein